MYKGTMKETNIHIYSDASFSKENHIAVAGFLLFENDDSHIAPEISQPIQTKVFKEKNNIRAELQGVIFALETSVEKLEQTDSNAGAQNRQINLYTDCQSIARLLGRRKRLESSNFMSNRTKKSLSNADLYKRFFTVYDKITPNLFWVKGHTSKKDRDLIQQNFSHVDKAVRKVLRRTI
jgi:ribonuclease HI